MRIPTFLLAAALVFAQSGDLAQESRRAKEMMAAGHFEDAIAAYKQLVRAVPGNPGLLLNLALAQHMAGRDSDAIPNFEALLRVQPKLLPALISLGAARLAMNEPKAAIPPLQKALDVDPANAEVRGMLAGALAATGSVSQAAAHYRKLTEASAGDPRAWFGLGKTYEAMAETAFEQLQKMDTQSPWVTALLADTRVARRQFRSAFFFYSESLKKLPALHGIHAGIAELYRRSEHADWAAIEEAKESALPAPNCAAHAGECHYLAGRYLQAATLPDPGKATAEALYWQAKAANRLAAEAFRRLGQLPPSVELYEVRAGIARDQNQLLDAVKEWRAAIELAPGNPRLRYEMTVAMFVAKDYKSALAEATELLKTMPDSAELNFVAGDSLLRLEDPEKAVPYLNAAKAADPNLLAVDASLGLALLRVGKGADAVPHLEKSLELDDDGTLHFQLARAYQTTGESEKARAAMAKYQEIVKRNQEAMDEAGREAQIAPPR